MNKQEIFEQIDHIDQKVRLLAEKLENLQFENKELQEENNKLKGIIEEKQEKIRTLGADFTANSRRMEEKRDLNPGKTKQIRKEIDHYISEIDKCIEWLQNS